jgi:tetratricopeptide (TPR) repeat protein
MLDIYLLILSSKKTEETNNNKDKDEADSFQLSSTSEAELLASPTTNYEDFTGKRKFAQILLMVADGFCNLYRYEEASSMIKNARIVLGDIPSADIHYQHARVFEGMQSIDKAVLEYESALIRDSGHKNSLLRMGLIHFAKGKKMLARSYLMSAVRVDPAFYDAWYNLGVVLKEMGELSESSDCFLTALKLYKTAPILPFDVLLKREL